MKFFNLYIILFALSVYSCNSIKSKKYIVIVHSKEPSLFGLGYTEKTDSTISEYISDSAAYFGGKLKFEISKSVANALNTGRQVYDFEVLNEKRENIKYNLQSDVIAILDKKAIDAGYRSGKSLKESIDKKDDTIKVVEETPRIKELKKKFRIKKDEFDENNLEWHEHKSSPKFRNSNGFYCYFSTKNGIPNKLRIVHQYYSDEWLFIRNYKFSIDDKAFSYSPYNIETDSGDGGMIWEWSDVVVDSDNKEIIDALIKCKSAKIRLEGRQYYDVKTISKSQINAISETVELFKLLGGSY